LTEVNRHYGEYIIEDGNDTRDDGMADGTDAVDDSHQAAAYGVEDGSDLLLELVSGSVYVES
jgi:hypothetical protein